MPYAAYVTAIDSSLQFFASDFQNQRLPSGKNDLTFVYSFDEAYPSFKLALGLT